tara:strand:- start:431 stop:880 length:450 start_codon:yes stop_codon:yes gene_type:complete
MSWKKILKRFDGHDDKGYSSPSHLEESNIWEDMENPHEMKDFVTKDQIGGGIHHYLENRSYVGFDKFITDFKRVSGKTKFNRGRYGVSNMISHIMGEIGGQEDNLEQRKALWEIMQRHFKNAPGWEKTYGEGWTTDEKNIPSWKKEKVQ